MKRMKVLIGKRRVMVIATLAILVLAAAALAASSASFTSTSANTGNVFTSGNLQHTNTGALLSVSHLKPDNQWIAAGTVRIDNTGDIAGRYTMTGDITEDTTGGGVHTGHLSDVLNVRIHAASDPATTYKYNGPVKDMDTAISMGDIAASTGSETYTFEIQFPNGTTAYTEDAGDNLFKGSSLTVAFNWLAINLP